MRTEEDRPAIREDMKEEVEEIPTIIKTQAYANFDDNAFWH